MVTAFKPVYGMDGTILTESKGNQWDRSLHGHRDGCSVQVK